jgi:cbb3-type cytochrome oxidase maturation protein
MSVVYVLLPLALLGAAAAVAAFAWAARSGQFDDLDTPPVRMLLDDDEAPTTGVPHDLSSRTGDQERSARPGDRASR